MILRVEPITTVIIAILLGWAWTQVTTDHRPICYQQLSDENVVYHKPVYCEDLETFKVK